MPQNHITKELNTHLDHIDIDSSLEATQVIDDNEIIDAVHENEKEAEDKCPSVSRKIASKIY